MLAANAIDPTASQSSRGRRTPASSPRGRARRNLFERARAVMPHGVAAVVSFYALPLTFLSSTLIADELMPAWMRWASRFNPVNWAVEAARQTMVPDADWAAVAGWLGLLLAATAATCAFATWAFRAYRRTL